jgi:hypothetical protein
MGSWITLLASMMIGGMVLLSFQQFNYDVNRDTYLETLDHIAYDNLDEIKQIIEYDFSRIGLGVNDPTQVVVTEADSNEFTFRLDSDSNGVLETMRYYSSSTTESNALQTPNPNDRVLYRQVNGGTPQIVATGLTKFKIQYFNSAGNAAGTFSAIKTLVVNLTMESNYGTGAEFPKLVWQGRITPPSLVTF